MDEVYALLAYHASLLRQFVVDQELALSIPLSFPQCLGDPDEYAHFIQALIENPILL